MLLRWVRECGMSVGNFFISAGIVFVIVMFILILTGKQPDISFLSVALALFSLGLALVSITLSLRSYDRTEAMANLEFYEKIAVIENYITAAKSKQSVVVEAIYNDIKGAKQLKKYVDPEIEQKLDNKIQELIGIASQDALYGDLVKKLQTIQGEF